MMFHSHNWVLHFRRWAVSGEPIEKARVMLRTDYCQQGLDITRYTSPDIVTTKIAFVGAQVGHLA